MCVEHDEIDWSTKQLSHFSLERLGILAYGLARLHPDASREAVQRVVEEAGKRTQTVGVGSW